MTPKRQRKSLEDSTANAFVFGASEPPKPPATEPEPQPTLQPAPQPKPQKKELSSTMQKMLEPSEKEATVRITVDLPQSLHQRLSLFSARSGKSKADIVRALLDGELPPID